MMSIYANVPPPPTELEVRQASRRSWVIIAVLCAFVALLVLLLVGRSMSRNYRLAHTAIDEFHGRLDRGDYASIYENATATFQGADSRDNEVKLFEKVHQKMGNSGAMTPIGFHVNWQFGRTVVNEVFSTNFEQGTAQEGFIWIIYDDEPKLQSYQIDAPQFH